MTFFLWYTFRFFSPIKRLFGISWNSPRTTDSYCTRNAVLGTKNLNSSWRYAPAIRGPANWIVLSTRSKAKSPAFLQGAATAWCRLKWPYSFTCWKTVCIYFKPNCEQCQYKSNCQDFIRNDSFTDSVKPRKRSEWFVSSGQGDRIVSWELWHIRKNVLRKE